MLRVDNNNKLLELTAKATIENKVYYEIADLLEKDNANQYKHDVDVNCTRESDLSTPLHLAVENGEISTIKLLLEHGSVVDKRRQDGKTALSIALQNKNLDVAAMLLQAGAIEDINCVNESDSSTLLHLAVEQKNHDLIKLLKMKGVHLDARKQDGKTPLYIAVLNNDIDTATLLLDLSADVNKKARGSSYTKSPLVAATINNDHEMVNLLLDRGANANALNTCIVDENSSITDYREHVTALHIAARHGYAEIFRSLVAHEAHVNYQNSGGVTPAWYASFYSNDELLTNLPQTLYENNRLEELAKLCQGNHNIKALINIKDAKETIWNNINFPNHPDSINKKIKLLEDALNPNHPLGQVMHVKRGVRKCSNKRGYLLRIQRALTDAKTFRDQHQVKEEDNANIIIQMANGQPDIIRQRILDMELRAAACSANDYYKMYTLLEEGANADHVSYDAGSALSAAIKSNDRQNVALILSKKKENVTVESFLAAVKSGNAEMIKTVVNHIINSEKHDRYVHLANLINSVAESGEGFLTSIRLNKTVKIAKEQIITQIKSQDNDDTKQELCTNALDEKSGVGKIMYTSCGFFACKKGRGSLKEVEKISNSINLAR